LFLALCRFRLYGSWKGEALLLNHPSLLRKRVDVVKKIKHLMRRISKENVKPMGRQLGKLAHSMPAVIFDYVSYWLVDDNNDKQAGLNNAFINLWWELIFQVMWFIEKFC